MAPQAVVMPPPRAAAAHTATATPVVHTKTTTLPHLIPKTRVNYAVRAHAHADRFRTYTHRMNRPVPCVHHASSSHRKFVCGKTGHAPRNTPIAVPPASPHPARCTPR